VLADTGCITNILTSDFMRRHNFVSPSPALQFGKKETGPATHIASVNLKRRGYSRTIDFLVFHINHGAIIGTSWFESITINQLDWRHRVFCFEEKRLTYDWSKIVKPSHRFKRVSYINRDTRWAAPIHLRHMRNSNTNY
jgi:hypothetical protein